MLSEAVLIIGWTSTIVFFIVVLIVMITKDY